MASCSHTGSPQPLAFAARMTQTRVAAHVRAVGLPSEADALPAIRWDASALIERMRHDKKVRDGRITFVLTRGIGQAFLSRDVPREALGALLDQAFPEENRSASH